MKKLMAMAIVSSIATGCTSFKTQPLTTDSANALEYRTIAQTQREKPDFAAMTAANGDFAPAGATTTVRS